MSSIPAYLHPRTLPSGVARLGLFLLSCLLALQFIGCTHSSTDKSGKKGTQFSSPVDPTERKFQREKKLTPVAEKRPGSTVDASIDPSEPPPPSRPPTFGGAGG